MIKIINKFHKHSFKLYKRYNHGDMFIVEDTASKLDGHILVVFISFSEIKGFMDLTTLTEIRVGEAESVLVRKLKKLKINY